MLYIWEDSFEPCWSLANYSRAVYTRENNPRITQSAAYHVSRELSHLYDHGLYKRLVRGLRKPRTSFLCRLYEQFTAYISRGLCSPQLIFPRINGPSMSLSFQLSLKMEPSQRPTCTQLLKHDFFTNDNFAERFTQELRMKISREMAENPLLKTRRSKSDKDSSEERARRREKKEKKVRWLCFFLYDMWSFHISSQCTYPVFWCWPFFQERFKIPWNLGCAFAGARIAHSQFTVARPLIWHATAISRKYPKFHETCNFLVQCTLYFRKFVIA